MRLREVRSTYGPVAGAPKGPRPQIAQARDAALVIVAMLTGSVVERFGLLSLDTKHRVIGWDVVSVGSTDAAVVQPRDVFRTACLQNATSIIVAHNHPSGDPTPSPDDTVLTTRLRQAGALIGITVLDHIIVGDEGRYFSFNEQGGGEVSRG
jgi:DNA repair protein RadC